MTSPDVFLSSPRVTRRMAHAAATSSPELPDINDLIKTQKPARPPLKSGSKAAAIPDDAFTGFTTARGLWQSAQNHEAATTPALRTADPIYLSGEDDSVYVVEAPPKPEKRSKPAPKPRKPRKQKVAVEEPPAATIEATRGSSPRTPSKDQPWRKYRPSPKSLAVSSPLDQSYADDAPPSAQVPLEEPRLLETESVSKHFKAKRSALAKAPKSKATAEVVEPLENKLVKPAVEQELFDMEPAPLRRLDWTPPTKDPRRSEEPAVVHGAKSSMQKSVDSPEDQPKDGFKDLLQNYNCSEGVAQAPPNASTTSHVGLGKRKLIEPVLMRENSASERSRSSSPSKKKPPKKPRTITELATAAYRIQEPVLTQPAALLNYVTVEEQGSSSAAKADDKRKAKSRKHAPPKTSKKKAAPPKPVLLSPGAALRHVANQDFVFGTSSQLAQEKSPTFLRSLHTAMMQSNELEEPDFATPLNSDAIEPPEQRPRLWDAAARDADGELFDVEVVNLVDASPTLPRIVEEADPFGYRKTDEAADDVGARSPSVNPTEADDLLMSLSDLVPTKSTASRPPTQAQPTLSILSESEPPQAILSRRPTVQVNTPEPTLPAVPDQPERPAYETFTDAQLSRQVSRYGFKPVKRRATMIALLDNCWKSQLASGRLTSVSPMRPMTTTSAASAKSTGRPRGRPKKGTASPTTAQEPLASAQPTTPTKKPRGRPRKDATTTSKATTSGAKKRAASPVRRGKARAAPKSKATASQVVMEIPDSESDPGSVRSVSRSVSPEALFSSPTAANQSVVLDDDTEMSLTMSPTDQQAALFEHVTKAVTSAPRSKDVTNPSWHEKILLYDPIVVEDLAAWLNSGQLTSVGHDGEISPAEVKKWCESMSVCCLWRDTQRGKERKRY